MNSSGALLKRGGLCYGGLLDWNWEIEDLNNILLFSLFFVTEKETDTEVDCRGIDVNFSL